MPTRIRKTRKLRGHVSHGHGRVGKHRKHPSGRGKSGGQHHHRIAMDKFHPGFYGKVGMRIMHMKPHLDEKDFYVNVDHLWSMLPKGTYEKYKTTKDKSVIPPINCTAFKKFKVLGKGQLPKIPITVKARNFTKKAVIKIEETGGEAIRAP
eukprot:Filipodium_phascolosomae@DN1969_c0_g1_i1.p1